MFTQHLAQHLAFSKYRLLARLGSGGMADVFLAVSGHGTGGFTKLLVLKVLRPDLPATERAEFFRMFQDEGRLAMRLSHPAIVQAYEVGSDEDVSFIAMEYLDGQPLSAIQDRGWHGAPRVSLEQQLHVLCHVLDGLEYAHTLTDYGGRNLNIVHRDVSPQNVFVTYSGHVKLVDFGIAKTLESNSKTAAGVVKGKVPYMSPEQVRCSPVDHRADLFSVGVMLWEAAARRSMHGGASLYEILQRLVGGNLPRLRDAVPDVHPELDRITMRALSLKCEERHRDAAELRDDLMTFLEKRSKVTSRELGERVATLFGPERQAINEVIRKAMTDAVDAVNDDLGVEPAPTSTSTLVASLAPDIENPKTGRITVPTLPPAELRISPASYPGAVAPLAAAGSGEPPSGGTPNAVTVSGSALSPAAEGMPQKQRRARVVAAGAGVGVLVVALGLLNVSGRPSTSGPTLPGAPAPAVVSEGVSGVVSEPIQRRNVSLRLRAQPSSAVFSLDGQPLEGNPHSGERPADSRPHELLVSADAHEPRQIELRLDRDVDLEVRLAEVASPSAASAAESHRRTTAGALAAPRRAPPARPGARSRTSDEELYPDLPAPRQPLTSTGPAVSPAPVSDEDLYPDLAAKPRARPRLDTSESPW